MRFHLVYSGPLASAGNKPKPREAGRIRRELSSQLRNLWDTHHSLYVLRDTGGKPRTQDLIMSPETARQIAERDPSPYEDCLVPLSVGDKEYRPLVRKSLDLNCELSILFLRQQDPGELVTQAGDIDGRVKTLLDALTMPKKEQQERADPFPEKGLFVLMESDTLISRLDVDTDRLLFPQTEKPDEVHLIVEVRLNVLRVGAHNMCLL